MSIRSGDIVPRNPKFSERDKERVEQLRVFTQQRWDLSDETFTLSRITKVTKARRFMMSHMHHSWRLTCFQIGEYFGQASVSVRRIISRHDEKVMRNAVYRQEYQNYVQDAKSEID